MNLNKTWLVVGLLVVASGIGLWFWTQNKGNDGLKYELATAEKRTLLDTISAPGTVVPRNRVEIIPPIGGRIEKILVQEGDYVRKGGVLAVMSSTDRAALLDVARTESPAQGNYWENVYQPTRLFAPLNGQVIVRGVEPGQTVNASTVVFVIADELIVKAQVDETDIGKIKVGMPVIISLDAYAGQSVTGNVDHISYESTVVNNVSVYDVEIRLPVVPSYFRSGMTATAQIIRTQKENVVAVPEPAIQYGKHGTFLIPKSSAKPRSKPGNHANVIRVTTGTSTDGWTEIVSGKVNVGDSFLIPKQDTEGGKKRSKGLFNFRPQGGSGSRGGGSQGSSGGPGGGNR